MFLLWMVTELVAILKDTNSSFREWLYTRDFLLRNKHFGVNLFISTEKKKKSAEGKLITTIKKLKTVMMLESMAEEKLCQTLLLFHLFSKSLLRFSDLYFNLSVIIKV